LCGTVDEHLVGEIVASMTVIPLKRLVQGEATRLLELESHRLKKVSSQDEAISAVSRAIRRSRSGLKDPRRPVGAFMLVGPTGVGKTLLCQALVEFMVGACGAVNRADS